MALFQYTALSAMTSLSDTTLVETLHSLGTNSATFLVCLVWGFASNVVPKVLITSIVNYALAVFWGPAAYVALAIMYIERAGGLGSLRRDLFI